MNFLFSLFPVCRGCDLRFRIRRRKTRLFLQRANGPQFLQSLFYISGQDVRRGVVTAYHGVQQRGSGNVLLQKGEELPQNGVAPDDSGKVRSSDGYQKNLAPGFVDNEMIFEFNERTLSLWYSTSEKGRQKDLSA